MSNNYDRMLDSARALFLTHDQGEIIARWGLAHDADALYADYMGQRLRIDRHDAAVSFADPPAPGEFRAERLVNEGMALFDLLTRPRSEATGRWSSISTLGGIIGAGHERTLSNEPIAARFSGKTDALARACERLGGVPDGKADVGFAIPVFQNFRALFQFWDGDDEFPASIKYLFDENALRFMHYETLWYVMGSLADRLEFYVNQ